MSVIAIDPRAALIVVDLQKGIVSLPTAQPIGEVVANAAALAAAFRCYDLPVVLVNVAGAAPGRTEVPRSVAAFPPGWTDLIPELDRQPIDHTVTKHTPGAFTGTGLDDYLKAQGVTQVVIAGVATSNGVEVTARQAFELGFNVAFAVDAMTDMRAEAHAYCLAQVFPRIGETGTTRDIIAMVERRT